MINYHFYTIQLDILPVTLFRVLRASCAAVRAGSAFVKSSSQSFCFLLTSSAISPTLYSSSSAVKFNNSSNYLYVHVQTYLSMAKLSTPVKAPVLRCDGKGADTF